MDNPWDIVSMGKNLSNHERQRFYLNHRGSGFFDLSFLSGADAEGDGRAVVAGDLRNAGLLDVVVARVGGGAITIYENQLPPRHFLEVSLRGRQSNRLGIGARLIAEIKGQTQAREVYPINSFASQMPARAHFGLADADKIDRLTIRWPSGQVQVLSNVQADRHIAIDEGKKGTAAVETIVPGKAFLP